MLTAAVEQGIDPDSTYYVSAPFTYQPDPSALRAAGRCVETYGHDYCGSTSVAARDAPLRQHRLRAADARRRARERRRHGAQARRPLLAEDPRGRLRPVARSRLRSACPRSTWRPRTRRSPPAASTREPMAIRKVVLPDGKVDDERRLGRAEAQARDLRRSRLRGDEDPRATTSTHGTGTRRELRRARRPARPGRPRDHADAWFCGYTPDLSTTVWVGYPHGEIPMTNVHGISVAGGTFPARDLAPFMGRGAREPRRRRVRAAEGVAGLDGLRAAAVRALGSTGTWSPPASTTTPTPSRPRRRRTTSADRASARACARSRSRRHRPRSRRRRLRPRPRSRRRLRRLRPTPSSAGASAAVAVAARRASGCARRAGARLGVRGPRLAGRLAARPAERRPARRRRRLCAGSSSRRLRGLRRLRRSACRLAGARARLAAGRRARGRDPAGAARALRCCSRPTPGPTGATAGSPRSHDGNPVSRPAVGVPGRSGVPVRRRGLAGHDLGLRPGVHARLRAARARGRANRPTRAAWIFKSLGGARRARRARAGGAPLAAAPSFACAFVGWNPLLALHFAGGGHNDALDGGARAGRAGARGLAAGGRWPGAAWALAVLVKWVPLLFLPLRALEARATGRRLAHRGFARRSRSAARARDAGATASAGSGPSGRSRATRTRRRATRCPTGSTGPGRAARSWRSASSSPGSPSPTRCSLARRSAAAPASASPPVRSCSPRRGSSSGTSCGPSRSRPPRTTHGAARRARALRLPAPADHPDLAHAPEDEHAVLLEHEAPGWIAPQPGDRRGGLDAARRRGRRSSAAVSSTATHSASARVREAEDPAALGEVRAERVRRAHDGVVRDELAAPARRSGRARRRARRRLRGPRRRVRAPTAGSGRAASPPRG